MDHQIVEKLEEHLETAIAEVMRKLGGRALPLKPTPQIIHLMAKAAVTVYEAAVENHHPD